MTKLSELEAKVFSLKLEERNELLKWFAEAYYYNDELLKDGVYDEIFIRLLSKYKPLTEDIIGLEFLKKIKKGERKPNQTDMSFIVLEQIMIGLKGELGLDVEHGIYGMLFDYHAKYNKDFINELYMEHLKDNIGNKVYVVGRNDKQPILEAGELQAVDDYHSVKVNNQDINFIGYKHYIKTIKDDDNRVLYYNGNDYTMNMLVEPEDIATQTIILFNKDNVQKAQHAYK